MLSGIAVLVIAWNIGGINLNKYFNVQAKDLSVWKDMNAPQGPSCQAVAEYGDDYDIYVTAIFRDIPPSLYLAPGVQTNMWPGMQALPLNPGKPKGAVLDPGSPVGGRCRANCPPVSSRRVRDTHRAHQP